MRYLICKVVLKINIQKKGQITFFINKYGCDDDNGDNKNTLMAMFSMRSHKQSIRSDKGRLGFLLCDMKGLSIRFGEACCSIFRVT